jgi:hypothetical protein
MKLQFVDQKRLDFTLCKCNGHNYLNDLKTMAYITADGIRFFLKEKDNVKELIQFPYTFEEWQQGSRYEPETLNKIDREFTCKKCRSVRYRIIKNKDYIANNT